MDFEVADDAWLKVLFAQSGPGSSVDQWVSVTPDSNLRGVNCGLKMFILNHQQLHNFIFFNLRGELGNSRDPNGP